MIFSPLPPPDSPSQSDIKVRVPTLLLPSLEHYHQGLNHSILSYFNHSLSPSLLKLVDATSPIKTIHTNCTLPQRTNDDCSYGQFEALLNIADRTVCKCENSRLSIGNRCISKYSQPTAPSASPAKLDSHSDAVTVFAVTPTYTRYTQKADLTNLCYTIQHVPNVLWIVVEDSVRKTDLVTNLLGRCKVRSAMYTVHMYIHTRVHTYEAILYTPECGRKILKCVPLWLTRSISLNI